MVWDKVKSIIDKFDAQVGFNNIQAKLILTTNERYKKYEMSIADLSLKNMMAFFDINSFHTSYIIQVYLERNELIITTRNSTYIFEIQDEELLEWFEDGILFELGDKDIKIIEKYLEGKFNGS